MHLQYQINQYQSYQNVQDSLSFMIHVPIFVIDNVSRDNLAQILTFLMFRF